MAHVRPTILIISDDPGSLAAVESAVRPTLPGATLQWFDASDSETAELGQLLTASQQRYQRIFDNAPIGLFHCSHDGHLLDVNPMFAKILGAANPDALIGKRLGDFFVDQAEAAQWQGTCAVANAPMISEIQMQCGDGATVWVRIRIDTVPDLTSCRSHCEGILEEIGEQRRAEEALRASEDKLRLIFEHAFDGISIYEELPENGSRRLLQCNDRYVEMAGRSRKELMEIGNTSLLQRKVGRAFTRSENLYLRQNMVRYRGFFSWNRLDSRENVIEYSAAPIYVDGRPLTIGIDRDITEQMRSKEEALRRAAHLEAINAVIGVGASSDSVHELMQQSSRQLAVALLADGVVLWVGGQISALGRTTHDAMLWQQRFEPDATAAYLVHESDGDRGRGRRLLAAPIIHEGRRLGGFVVSAVDVDVWPQDALALADVIGYTVGAAIGRLRLLEQTQMQARQMQMLIDAAPDGILLLDGRQRVVTMNPAAREALTVLGSVEAGDLLETLGPRRIDELLSMQSAANFVEIELKEKSLAYAVNVRPVFVQDMTHGWMLTLRNITGERDRQQRSEQQGRLAAVGQLAAGIAHDFNNILAVTLLLAQLLLQEEPLPEKARQRVQTIIDQTNHAAELVRQILDFSRKSVIRQTFGDLAALLDETAELLRRTLPGNIRIVVEHSLQGFSVEADFTRLKQVLMNLAVNAQDAMPAGGVLAIRLDRILVTPAQAQPLAGLAAGEWLRLTVADTGVGISADVLPRIFEPFFTTKEVGKGTGLGLAQVYGIVHQHGGEIQVESRKHDGTTFSIYLPAPPTSQPKVVEPAQSSSGQMPRPTLLYVEDDPVLRQTICDLLQMYGFTILSAASGEDALVHHAGRLAEIDLVVSDLSMPGMSGIELHHALRNRRPGICTIILSGYPAEREQSDWQQEGIVAWMQKPVSTKDLVAQIREVL